MKNSLAMHLFMRSPSAWNMEEYANNIEAGLLAFLPGETSSNEINPMPPGITYDPLSAVLANAAIAFERNLDPQSSNYRTAMVAGAERVAAHLLSGGANLFGAVAPGSAQGHSLALELAVRGPCLDAVKMMRSLPGCPPLKDLAAFTTTTRYNEPRPLLVHLSFVGNLAAVALLLEAGADPHLATESGQTGPHVTSSPGVLELFAKHGFKPNAADAAGSTVHMTLGARRDIPTRQIDELRQVWKKFFGSELVHDRYATLSQGLAGKTKTLLQKEMSALRWRHKDTEDGRSLVQALATTMLDVPARLQRSTTSSFILENADLSHVGPLGVSDGLLVALAAIALPGGELHDPKGERLVHCPEVRGTMLEIFEKILPVFDKLRAGVDTSDDQGLSGRFYVRLLCALATRPGVSPPLAEWQELLASPLLQPFWDALPGLDVKVIEDTMVALDVIAEAPAALGAPSLAQDVASSPAAASSLFNFALIVVSKNPGSFYSRPLLGPHGMPTMMQKITSGPVEPRPGARILNLLWEAGARPSCDDQGQAAVAIFSKEWPAAGPGMVRAMLDTAVAPSSSAPSRLRM